MIAANRSHTGDRYTELREARTERFLTELAEAHKLIESRLSESVDPWSNYVDPREAYRDADGTDWVAIGGGGRGNASQGPQDFNGFATEQELTLARETCRRMFTYSEHVVNGHRNRVHYVVDTGHTYTAAPADSSSGGKKAADSAVKATQAFLKEFTKNNRWFSHQCEFQLRLDRDGEVFRRKIKSTDGSTRVVFIEPWQVRNPSGGSNNPNIDFGIETEPGDATKVVRYYVQVDYDGEPEAVDAAEIQHIKANVSANVRRGMPLVWVARKNIIRAGNSLRNIAAKTEMAAAHCLKKTLPAGTPPATAASFATAGTTVQRQNPTFGVTQTFKQYQPGTEVVTSDSVQWEALNLAEGIQEMVEGNKEVLRAVAAAFGQPEFMLTMDASNGNYSSTMVAEGPVVRGFRNAQQVLKEADCEIIEEARAWAVECGKLDAGSLETVEVNATLPNLITRDEAKEAEKHRIYKELGVVSPQTISGEAGYDYDREQANIAEWEKDIGRQWSGTPDALAGVDGDELDDGEKSSAPHRKPGASQNAAAAAEMKRRVMEATSMEEALQALRECVGAGTDIEAGA